MKKTMMMTATLLTACSGGGGEAPRPNLSPGAVSATARPSTVSIAIGGGILNAPYTIDDLGNVIVDGDINVGHEDDVFTEVDGTAMARVPAIEMWPSAVIGYELHSSVLGTPRESDVLEALSKFSYYTPIRFLETSSGPRVEFKYTPGSTGCSAEAGYPGVGKTNEVQVGNCGVSELLHELGHVAGLYHTHQRADAHDYVDYDSTCADPPGTKAAQWGVKGLMYGPYEYESIMGYSSFVFAKDGMNDTKPDLVTVEPDFIYFDVADVYDVGGAAAVFQDAYLGTNPFRYRLQWKGPGVNHRFEDIASTGNDYLLIAAPQAAVGLYPGAPYTLRLSNPHVRSKIPTAIAATGDLEDPDNWRVQADPDQARADCPVLLRHPVAVSSPLAVLPDHRLLDTPGTLSTLWNMYGPNSDRDGSPSAGNDFGTSYTTGDFNGDSLLDIAVAIPGDDRVAIYRGIYDEFDSAEQKFERWESLIVLGASVVEAGDFNGDGWDDLAIGSPSWDGDRGGLVVVMGSDRGLEHGHDPVGMVSERPPATDPYMNGLMVNVWEVGDGDPLTGDLHLTAVDIGGQFYDGGTAHTPVFGTDWNRAALPDFPTSTSSCDSGKSIAALLSPGSRFGSTLLAYDLDNDGLDELLVGAPGAEAFNDPVGASPASSFKKTGAVAVYRGIAPSAPTDPPLYAGDILTPYTKDTPTGSPLFQGSHNGAEFGAALAVAELSGADNCPDVLVGAPQDFSSILAASPPETAGDHTGTPSRSGRVFGFVNGQRDGCLTGTLAEESSRNGLCVSRFGAEWDFEDSTQQPGAEYGAAVTAEPASYGGPPIAAIGAPGYDNLVVQPVAPDAGIVDIWRFGGAPWPVGVKPEDQRVDGATHGTGGPAGDGPELNDRYGFSVDLVDGDLVVGAPGENSYGALYFLQESGGSFVTLGPNVLLGDVVIASDPSGIPFDARMGHQASWEDWEAGLAVGPGVLAGAPHDGPTGNGEFGRVIGIRGSTTSSGVAFSLAGTDIETVSQ